MTMRRESNALPVLSVEDVHKHFTLHLRAGQVLPVLQGVSLSVHAGECVALVGPSGRGKSTLMKCLYGSYHVERGRVLLRRSGGETIDLAQASPQTWLALRRGEIAYVSQFLRALPRVSALDVVAERLLQAQPERVEAEAKAAAVAVADAGAATAIDPWHDAEVLAAQDVARSQARALLARLNLPAALWDLPPATFSGGEQQRVNIARGFVQPARLLLLDEPTASLDAANRRVVVSLIHEAKAAGSAVVGIFHDEEVRDAVADRCIDMA